MRTMAQYNNNLHAEKIYNKLPKTKHTQILNHIKFTNI